MAVTGRCHCGAVGYTAEGEPQHHTLCHWEDCRRCAGAPAVGWIAFKEAQLDVTGTPITYESSGHGRRDFCGTCGTGLFYRNEAVLPGLVDIQSSTLDDAANHVPAAHIQTAERLKWMTRLGDLPEYKRYPGMPE